MLKLLLADVERQWRIKTNEELRAKYKSQDTVTVIKVRNLEWLGHVSRMNETGAIKICEGKLEGRKGVGRPRLRWINDVEDDLRCCIHRRSDVS